MAREGPKRELLLHSLAETCRRWERVLVFQKWWIVREKSSNFSLGFWPIGQSDFFEPRRKVVLRSEGFAWVPVLGSFDKLREVSILSYLVYS